MAVCKISKVCRKNRAEQTLLPDTRPEHRDSSVRNGVEHIHTPDANRSVIYSKQAVMDAKPDEKRDPINAEDGPLWTV